MILNTTGYYHIYNRANGSEKIFDEENYRFFLQQYQIHLKDYIDTYCCLAGPVM